MTRALRAKDTGGRDFLAPKCDAAQKAHAARMSVATHTFLSRGAKKAEKEAVHAANHTILAERARRQEAAGVPCPLEGPLHHGRGLLRDARDPREYHHVLRDNEFHSVPRARREVSLQETHGGFCGVSEPGSSVEATI